VRPAERRYLYTAIKTMAGEMRFLDKTPKNILKLPYLASLFPMPPLSLSSGTLPTP